MPAEESCGAAAAAAGCSCLPFFFWGSSRGSVAAPERRRRCRRFRLKLRLPWFSWPWLRRRGKKNGGDVTKAGRKARRRGRMLLLLAPSRAKKAPGSSASPASTLLPKQVSSSGQGVVVGDAKKQSRGEPRRPAVDTAPTTSCRGTAPAPAQTGASQPCAGASGRPAGSGVERAGAPSWRARALRPDGGASARPAEGPTWRAHSLRPDGGGGGTGLWTVATTLGVVVFFGRVTAVAMLCSCLYGARFVRAQTGRAAKAMAGGGGRFGDRTEVELQCTEEHKKKVVMEGFLDRAGTRPSSRFCR